MRSRSRALAPWLALFVLSATLAAPASAGTAVLSWTAPTLNTDGTPANLTGYGVHRRCQAGAVVQIATIPPTPLTYTDAGIPDDGRTCWYSLTAIDASGPSARTNEVSKTFATAPPPVPGSLVTGYTWSALSAGSGGVGFRSVTVDFEDDGTASFTVNTPTGLAAGDVILWGVSHDGSSETITWPSGFAEVTGSPVTSTADGQRLHVAKKVADGTEGASLTATMSSAGPAVYSAMAAYSGLSGAINATPGTGNSNAANGSPVTVTWPSVTTTVDNCLRVLFGALDSGSTPVNSVWGTVTGFTDRAEAANGYFDIFLADAVAGVAGATGAATSSVTHAGSAGWMAIHVCLEPAVSGGSTLAADAGSFTLTGAAAALIRGRKMPAVTAAYALSGTANALRRARPPLVGVTAAYALTGTANALRAGRRFAAVTAAYLLTGAANALRWGHALPAQSSSYSITGATAALRVARRIAGNTAAYALTGTAAALAYTSAGAKLVADGGAYVLTGSVTALRAARRMAANTAAFALAGTAAALTYSGSGAKTLIANAGAFALTGTATALRAARRMAGTTAAFTLSGTVALLYRGRRMPAATAAYVITGTATALRAVRRLVAQTALFLLTGTPASLTFGQTRYYYLAEALRIMASQIIASLGNTDVTIDYSGPGQASGIRAIRGQKSFDPSIGARFFGSSETEFMIDKLDQPASLAEGVLLRDETNGDVFRVRRLTYTRGGLTTISIKNIV